MGRLKGSKNKPKIQQDEKAIPLNIKDIRRELRLLRKIKKDTHKKSEDRHELCRKIRELRKQLTPIYKEVSQEKQILIDQILKIRPEYLVLNIDLRIYSEIQLTKHLETVKRKGRLI